MVEVTNEVILRAEGPRASGKTHLLERIKELLIEDGFRADMEISHPVGSPIDDHNLKITWTYTR